jgi:hypothetical protein
MPLTKKPNPLPSPLDYVPENSVPYTVTDQDSWYTLAERPEVKAVGMTGNDLCFFNFKTRDPLEINWYLNAKVGCQHGTRDTKNYVFSSSDWPGIVYLPKIGPQPPPHLVTPQAKPVRLNLWFGLVGKGGTMFGPVGIETVAGFAFSLDEIGKVMAITASVNRLGIGVGASGGASFVVVFNVTHPGQLNGHQEGDRDFNFAIEENWGKMAKSAKTAAALKKLEPLIKVFRRLGASTPGGLKKALKAHPDKWAELVKAGISLKDSFGVSKEEGPKVFMFDVPFSGHGVEVSYFFGVANFNAVWDNE